MNCDECEVRAEDCTCPFTNKACLCACHDKEPWRRSSGVLVCECGKTYAQHQHGGPIGAGAVRFLRRLCDGRLVKL